MNTHRLRLAAMPQSLYAPGWLRRVGTGLLGVVLGCLGIAAPLVGQSPPSLQAPPPTSPAPPTSPPTPVAPPASPPAAAPSTQQAPPASPPTPPPASSPSVPEAPPASPPGYEKKSSRLATIRALHAAHQLHNLRGEWWHLGPWDSPGGQGFETSYPPEQKIDLQAKYVGKGGVEIGWRKFAEFPANGRVNFLDLYPFAGPDAVAFLYHEFESDKEYVLPVSLGSDDSLSVWVNGRRVIHENIPRAAEPGQAMAEWKIVRGKNTLLIKIVQYGGLWEGIVLPEASPALPAALRRQLDSDFPANRVPVLRPADIDREARHYRIVTIEHPKDCVLEVGGLGFRPDGKLLICTRRGELWLLHNPLAEKLHRFTRYASGLHEPLGLHVENDRTTVVVQRGELTRLVDRAGRDQADEFRTICDAWSVSGGYHEYAFGPARDRDGNFFVTLNVNFGEGGQAPVPWRGWCLKISPDGHMEPWCYGLRSPNGVNFSPEGELFYCDNQGEWVATNKMSHLRRGSFHGHQASLAWLKDSPFAQLASAKVRSGMLYDGQAGPQTPAARPEVQPPAVWFPYGRMGQSASEPCWDCTNGRFGPFIGQCFVGDQTRSCIMRVALEQVNGTWQGACFPFRSGLQCGVNRLAFAPDGSLFAGQTARGWGSVGHREYGLQRLIYTGITPLEILTMSATPEGFELTFTQPLDPASVTTDLLTLKSFTYFYFSTYGSPEVDVRGEPVEDVQLSEDGRRVRFRVPHRVPGRVYELRAEVRGLSGEPILHPEAYYTLNEVPRSSDSPERMR